MKRKRMMGRRKPARALVEVANDPYLSIGYQEVDSTDTPTGVGSSSINPKLNAELTQGERTCQEEPRLPQRDPRYSKEELNASLLVIRIIMGMDEAEPFNVPVDPIALGIPDYFDVIDKPMDFGTICQNLENGVKYANSEDVFKDVQLIWENCCKYNKKGYYVLELMKRVKTNFLKFWAAAKLYMEQPQATNGYSHLHPRTASNMRHTKGGKEFPVGSDTDNAARQLQDQMGPSQVQSHRPSSIYSQGQHPPTTSNVSHSQHGQRCQEGLDTNNSTCQLPHQPSSIYNQKNEPLAESNQRKSKLGPVGSVTDTSACQLQGQMGPGQVQSHLPSSIYCQRDQPPMESSTRRSNSEPDTSSSQSHDSMQQPEANNEKASTVKQRRNRVRGPTRCLNLWMRDGNRIPVTTNELGQPVGDDAPKLTSFLGTMARDGLMAPLIYADWRAMPEANKERMWQEVEMKFDIDPTCKVWVMKSLGKKWKDWKANLKAFHYSKHATDEERLADRDERVLPDQWATLVSYWSSAEGEARSAKNKASRAQQMFQHTTGKKSFARIREEERTKRADGKEPSVSELFVLTRTRKDGRPVNEASAAVISQLQEQQETLDNSKRNEEEILSEIMGHDRSNPIRLGGLGPTPSNLEGFIPRAEAMKMASASNSEVREVKERVAAMEQTCAQMVTQMSTIMVMLSSMQSTPNKPQSNLVAHTPDASEGVPQQQVHPSTSRCPVSPLERRSSKRSKMQNASATTKGS